MKINKNIRILIIVLGVLILILAGVFFYADEKGKAFKRLQTYLVETGPTGAYCSGQPP